jgi:hypothetical protein
MSVTRVSQLAAAGRLADLRSPHAGGAVRLTAPFVVLLTLAVLLLAFAGSAPAAPLGYRSVTGALVNQDGSPDVQAGSHPYALTTTIKLNRSIEGVTETIDNFEVRLPPGLVANRFAVPRCHQAAVVRLENCPSDTQIGILWVNEGVQESIPMYNLVSQPNVPVEFGGELIGAARIVIEGTVVPAGGSYVAVARLLDGPSQHIGEVVLTLWGVPAASSHTYQRCNAPPAEESPSQIKCQGEGLLRDEEGQDPKASDVPPAPFLSLPASCEGPLTTGVLADTWEGQQAWFEGSFDFVNEGSGDPLSLGGCEKIGFSPSIEVTPETSVADTPTGLNVDVRVPQDENPNGLATANLREATVTLPEGLAVSPSTLNGRGVCSEAQIKLGSEAAPECPDSSKLASAEVVTPLLETPLDGSLYLAQQGNGGAAQGSNPFGSLAAFYLVVESSGVLIKLPGVVSLDPSTGQLTTRFGAYPLTGQAGLPQLPFNEFKLHFFGGPRAPLVTPPACGTYTTSSVLTPWSAPASGPPATPSSGFAIASGANGAPCGGEGLTPSFTAGTVDPQAGAYSAFTTTFSRGDQDQDLTGVQVSTPPGLLGSIANVPQCGDAQAQAGTCGAESAIGEVSASVGPGSDPFVVSGGHAYLTGPYKGAPFGLSIVVPAEAGPYRLDGAGTNGNGEIVVRAAINIDPRTSALTITSDPLPQIVEGVPLQVRSITVDVNRADFIFNPTSCAPKTISATLQGAQGATANVSAPFQATNCASLKFTPEFSVSTAGMTSRADGASLDVRVVYPSGSQGSVANIAKVKVELPKSLPARLTTLQKACLAATFEANPALCPADSVVGVARATTPLLPVGLSGPAYFVSYGGAQFPELIVVLQGDGVRVDLHGETFISKAGITSSTFNAIPDVPVGSFELYLPEGPYSALAANGDLCTSSLTMPTLFTAQNGAQLQQSTRIAVTGCPSSINVVRHSVRGRAATIAVQVPSAGKLVATGTDLSRGTGKSGGAGTVTVKLTLSKGEQAFLAKHRGRKLRADVNLQFTPRTGSRLKTTTTVLIA